MVIVTLIFSSSADDMLGMRVHALLHDLRNLDPVLHSSLHCAIHVLALSSGSQPLALGFWAARASPCFLASPPPLCQHRRAAHACSRCAACSSEPNLLRLDFGPPEHLHVFWLLHLRCASIVVLHMRAPGVLRALRNPTSCAWILGRQSISMFFGFSTSAVPASSCCTCVLPVCCMLFGTQPPALGFWAARASPCFLASPPPLCQHRRAAHACSRCAACSSEPNLLRLDFGPPEHLHVFWLLHLRCASIVVLHMRAPGVLRALRNPTSCAWILGRQSISMFFGFSTSAVPASSCCTCVLPVCCVLFGTQPPALGFWAAMEAANCV